MSAAIYFFVADDGSTGRELWRSDGTTTGTVLVKDLDEVRYYSSEPRDLANVSGKLYFTAGTGMYDARRIVDDQWDIWWHYPTSLSC